MNNTKKVENLVKIKKAIEMLNKHTQETSLKPFIAILEALTVEPENEQLLEKLYDEFQNLGIHQGAVLTYAPSIYNLIVDDPFND